MSAHAKYAPSSAHRVRRCFASARMEKQFPQEDTQDTREGTAVHWAGAELLRGGVVALGQVVEGDVVLNVEMIEAAEMWAAHVLSRGRGAGLVEETLPAGPLHPENWGTPDHWDFDWSTMTLYLDDLKYGHRWVDVYLNDQLINYAALILATLGLFSRGDIKIVCTLVLPRCYTGARPIQTWITTSGEMFSHWNALSAAFHAADNPDAPCNATDVSACYDCSARHACEANQRATAIAVHVVSQPVPLHLSPQAMAKYLRVLRDAEMRIKSMREGVEQSIIQTIRRHRTVPGFALQSRPGREVFTDEASQNGVVEISALYGVDVVKRRELITPKQAIKAGVPAHVVKMYSRTNSGALELVEDDGSAAARVFNQPKE